MAEGESRSEVKREDDAIHGRIVHEPWFIKFLRRMRQSLVYGTPTSSISGREYRKNAALEETPEDEMRELQEEIQANRSDI